MPTFSNIVVVTPRFNYSLQWSLGLTILLQWTAKVENFPFFIIFCIIKPPRYEKQVTRPTSSFPFSPSPCYLIQSNNEPIASLRVIVWWGYMQLFIFNGPFAACDHMVQKPPYWPRLFKRWIRYPANKSLSSGWTLSKPIKLSIG